MPFKGAVGVAFDFLIVFLEVLAAGLHPPYLAMPEGNDVYEIKEITPDPASGMHLYRNPPLDNVAIPALLSQAMNRPLRVAYPTPLPLLFRFHWFSPIYFLI